MIKKILISPDKFKFSLSSLEISQIIQNSMPLGVKSTIISLADGGQGSIETISQSIKGRFIKCKVKDPLFRPIEAEYFQSEKEHSYIQMARASGLALLKKQQRNPLLTSTYGTGQLILDSLEKGHQKINLLIGGSATNDGGIGAANALGYQFLDRDQQVLQPIGKNLKRIKTIVRNELFERMLKKVEINVYTDVNNLFTGEQGASFIYSPQKEATQEMAQELEEGMLNLSELFLKYFDIDINKMKGSGAAGGLGGGSHVFLNANIKRGFDLICQVKNYERQVQNADLIITGEGKVDIQTMQGKVVQGVIDLAAKYNKKTLILCAFADEPSKKYFSRHKNVELIELLSQEERSVIDKQITKQKLINFCQKYFKEMQMSNQRVIL